MKEFACSLETLGCVFPEHEMLALFNKIDRNCTGKLDYEEFSAWFAMRGSGNNPNVNPVFGLDREVPHQVVDKIKAKVASRPGYAMAMFRNVFHKMDKNGDARLDRHEVQWGLREDGHVLSPSEFERLFKYFDRNCDGVVDINEFFAALCPELSSEVRACAEGLFDKNANNADKANCQSCCSSAACCDNKVCLRVMANKADWMMMPEVKQGRMSVEQAK